jgi:pyruvate,orthophosphate dikinase
MYSDVVLGVDHHHFEDILDTYKDSKGYTLDTDLTADDWSSWSAATRAVSARPASLPAGSARAALGRDRRGVRLVDECARGHLSPPARHSRKLGHGGQRAGHGVRQHGRDSATGVAFTRNPSTGEKRSSTANS